MLPKFFLCHHDDLLRLDEEFNFFFDKSASAVLFGLLSFKASDFWIDGLLCWRLSYAVCFASRGSRLVTSSFGFGIFTVFEIFIFCLLTDGFGLLCKQFGFGATVTLRLIISLLGFGFGFALLVVHLVVSFCSLGLCAQFARASYCSLWLCAQFARASYCFLRLCTQCVHRID